MIITARIENDDTPGLYRLVLNHDGRIVMSKESYTVCSRVADALVRDEGPTEVQEIADRIKGL